jgi:exonuclease SbcC
MRAAKRAKQESVKDLDEKIRQLEEKEKSKLLLGKEVSNATENISSFTNMLSAKIAESQELRERIDELYKIKGLLMQKESQIKEKMLRLKEAETEIGKLFKEIERIKESLKIYSGLKKPDSEADVKALRGAEIERDGLVEQKAVALSDMRKLNAIYESGKCAVCGQNVARPDEFKANIEAKMHLERDFAGKILQLDIQIARLKSLQEENRKYRAELDKKELVEKSLKGAEERKSGWENKKAAASADMANVSLEAEQLANQVSGFEGVSKMYSALEADIKSLQLQKLEIEKTKSRLEQQLEDAEEYITLYASEIEKKKKDRETISRIDELTEWMDSYFINLMEIIEKHVMAALLKEFNATFQRWFGILMADDLQVRLDSAFSPIIEQNGYETNFQNLSGGEKTAVALAYRLALNNVINSMMETIKTKDILILDEPTDGFSTEQLDKIRDVINELKLRQIIIVSHEPKIDSFVDNVIRLYKEDHVSRVEKN